LENQALFLLFFFLFLLNQKLIWVFPKEDGEKQSTKNQSQNDRINDRSYTAIHRAYTPVTYRINPAEESTGPIAKLDDFFLTSRNVPDFLEQAKFHLLHFLIDAGKHIEEQGARPMPDMTEEEQKCKNAMT
jgi:hypothetical protein